MDYTDEEENTAVYEEKYFCFDTDLPWEDSGVRFYTGNNPKFADDSPPDYIYTELERLLSPHFPSVSIGDAESLHTIPCSESQYETVSEMVRQILISAGWKESNRFGY